MGLGQPLTLTLTPPARLANPARTPPAGFANPNPNPNPSPNPNPNPGPHPNPSPNQGLAAYRFSATDGVRNGSSSYVAVHEDPKWSQDWCRVAGSNPKPQP